MTSVCWSLQCLISTLTEAGRGRLLFRFACSVVLWGGRGAADKCHWPLWGALALFWPHWVCPRSGRVCYTAQAPGCPIASGPCVACASSFGVLRKDADSVVPAFCAFPGLSSSGSQELDERTLPGCSVTHPLRGPSLSFRACRLSSPCVFLGSWSLAVTLPIDVNHPESQEVFG